MIVPCGQNQPHKAIMAQWRVMPHKSLQFWLPIIVSVFFLSSGNANLCLDSVTNYIYGGKKIWWVWYFY